MKPFPILLVPADGLCDARIEVVLRLPAEFGFQLMRANRVPAVVP